MHLIGKSVPRTEDERLITGRGRFTDNFQFANESHLIVVRSPHAHAKIARIDVTAARQAPGVLCALTGFDFAQDGLGSPPTEWFVPLGPVTRIRGALFYPLNLILPVEKVRHVGEPVAIVVAESAQEAREAAELVEVDYEPLDSLATLKMAIERGPDVPQIWDNCPGNLCGTIDIGDREKCAAAFAGADVIVKASVNNNRVIGSPMEPRAAVGYVDPETGAMTLICGTQLPNPVHQALVKHVFRTTEDGIRVLSPDMGGGFGTRVSVFPEYIFVLWCARRLGRPVRWLGDRCEAFLSDPHGRDSYCVAELALRRDGKIAGLKVETWANIGAYSGVAGALVPVAGGPRVQTGVYDVPALDMQVHVLFTNTVNVAPYRGAGQPEAVYLIERLLDLAAIKLGIDRIRIRRINLLAKDAFPYKSAAGAVYDSGEYEIGMDMALRNADWYGFEARAAASRRLGKRRGIGIANYVQVSGGAPEEWGKIEVDRDGFVTYASGTHSHGQSHATTYAQIVAHQLRVPLDRIRIVQGDTTRVKDGQGTHGSRSLFKAGEIAMQCSPLIIEKARRLAAQKFEAPPEGVQFEDDHFSIRNTNFTADLFELAGFSLDLPANAPEGLKGGLVVELKLKIFAANFPSGTHVCEVEVDPETGHVDILRYTAVDDAGRLVNPMVAEGQIHGGIAQGIGQALQEEIVYSEDAAQLTTGSFMDYGMPRAADLPIFDVTFQEVPSPTSQLGVKGIGESGSTGAPPALISAIVDAIKEFGVSHIDMPATPEKIWRAIHRNSRTTLPAAASG